MEWIRTGLLAVIAACLVLLVAGKTTTGRQALAEENGTSSAKSIVCESWTIEWDLGRNKGSTNVEAHRVEMERRINRLVGEGYVGPVYSNSFPIRSGINGNIVAEAGVYCMRR